MESTPYTAPPEHPYPSEVVYPPGTEPSAAPHAGLALSDLLAPFGAPPRHAAPEPDPADSVEPDPADSVEPDPAEPVEPEPLATAPDMSAPGYQVDAPAHAAPSTWPALDPAFLGSLAGSPQVTSEHEPPAIGSETSVETELSPIPPAVPEPPASVAIETTVPDVAPVQAVALSSHHISISASELASADDASHPSPPNGDSSWTESNPQASVLHFAEPAVPTAVPTLDPLMGLPRAENPVVDVLEVDLLPEAVAGPPGHGRAMTELQVTEDDFSLIDVLAVMLDRGASDVHLTTGAHPTIRLSGSLMPLENFPRLMPESLQRVLYSTITQLQRERFEELLELDFAYSLPGRARFRVNMFRQRDSVGAVFRVIPYEIKTLEQLGIPPVVSNFANLPRGFVLVTGPTGSGKSTTLAAVVDLANRTRRDHIMTIEDPIEFLHKHKSCLINQREIGEDTWSFSNALKHVLRQDPDIILVGEMRDLETISVALTAAETGHLVFATLHTQDAAQTIDRIIDVFPPHQQQQVRSQLAMALQGVVCQTLAKTADGRGRVVATEVLVVTPAIRNLIREGKTHQIYSAMQAGAAHGMHTLDQHLAELVRTRRVSYETALEKCHHIEDFNRLCGRA